MKKGTLLKQVKQAIDKRGVQAYIVPKNDEFFSGYMSKEKDRLYQLTNFTGSNGMAVVFSPNVIDPKT